MALLHQEFAHNQLFIRWNKTDLWVGSSNYLSSYLSSEMIAFSLLCWYSKIKQIRIGVDRYDREWSDGLMARGGDG